MIKAEGKIGALTNYLIIFILSPSCTLSVQHMSLASRDE